MGNTIASSEREKLDDPLGAYCLHGRVRIEGAHSGPLKGLTFVVKDLIDVMGISTGAGNPDYLAGQKPAKAHAWAVRVALEAGATLVGKTITDELAFSLIGRNVHYGTPINPAAPDRLPGGSSSGSVVLVAGGKVDFSLGSDTGGSVRIPASYCGVFGVRPTHGRIPLDGVVPFAPSFDTVGWFARDAEMLERIGNVMLGAVDKPHQPKRLLYATDAFSRADPMTVAALTPTIQAIESVLGNAIPTQVCPSRLEDWMTAFRTLRSVEVWHHEGPWIERVKPKFGPEIQRNFDAASKVTAADAKAFVPQRAAIVEHLSKLLADGTILLLPSAPGPAPRRDASYEELSAIRDRTQAITCISGLGGLPQLSIPAGQVEGAPVGLSLVAARGQDGMLLSFAKKLAGRIE